MATGTDPSLATQFAAFAKFGNAKSDGKAINLTNSDKWMKQANVIDGKKITTTDTAICFNKLRSKTIDMNDFMKYLEELARYKNVDPNELKAKLASCGTPGTSGATQAVHVGGVDRLTDTTQYTGTHRERFDESGRGKGLAGRVDATDTGGYVQGYKNEDTYDQSHKK